MGVYIKNAEMPKEGQDLRLSIYPNGQVIIHRETYWEEMEAVKVPPHGRLIDADAIPYNKIMLENDDFYYGVTMPYIDRMPTILPAEEGEE